jgi:hypothetical protein
MYPTASRGFLSEPLMQQPDLNCWCNACVTRAEDHFWYQMHNK